jgi:hypothetical protein
MKSKSQSKLGGTAVDRHLGRYMGIILVLIIILYTVSLMVEKLRF